MRRFRGFVFCLLAVFLVSAMAGCATKQEVGRVVAETNAALMSPYLEEPGKAGMTTAWKEPVERIDRLIAQYPDERKLVNHLRLRQAMLLTVYEQGNLAEERWKVVDGNELTTERDKSLHACWPHLVWWYKRAGIADPLDFEEMGKAEEALGGLDETLAPLPAGSDTKKYLGTIRAQIALKKANDSDVSSSEKKTRVEEFLVDSLRKYASIFQEKDVKWVRENRVQRPGELLSISDFRYRVWLREMIEAYRETASALEMEPIWEPKWIQNLNVNP